MTVLDCGCGPGSITLDLASVIAPGKIVGIDTDAKAIARAERRIVEQKVSNASFRQADVNELPYPNASFDAIYVNALLIHLSNPQTALTEIARVLKPDGILGVSEPETLTSVIFPPNEYVQQMITRIWPGLFEVNGGDPKAGRKLIPLLHEAGFTPISHTGQYEIWDGNKKNILVDYAQYLFSLSPILKLVEEAGLADQAWLDTLVNQELPQWRREPNAMWAHGWFQVVGKKAHSES